MPTPTRCSISAEVKEKAKQPTKNATSLKGCVTAEKWVASSSPREDKSQGEKKEKRVGWGGVAEIKETDQHFPIPLVFKRSKRRVTDLTYSQFFSNKPRILIFQQSFLLLYGKSV